MVTSIARQSVILKCNMQRAVMLGNYEFYYGAGVAGKIGGFEIPDDIKPLVTTSYRKRRLTMILRVRKRIKSVRSSRAFFR